MEDNKFKIDVREILSEVLEFLKIVEDSEAEYNKELDRLEEEEGDIDTVEAEIADAGYLGEKSALNNLKHHIMMRYDVDVEDVNEWLRYEDFADEVTESIKPKEDKHPNTVSSTYIIDTEYNYNII